MHNVEYRNVALMMPSLSALYMYYYTRLGRRAGAGPQLPIQHGDNSCDSLRCTLHTCRAYACTG